MIKLKQAELERGLGQVGEAAGMGTSACMFLPWHQLLRCTVGTPSTKAQGLSTGRKEREGSNTMGCTDRMHPSVWILSYFSLGDVISNYSAVLPSSISKLAFITPSNLFLRALVQLCADSLSKNKSNPLILPRTFTINYSNLCNYAVLWNGQHKSPLSGKSQAG